MRCLGRWRASVFPLALTVAASCSRHFDVPAPAVASPSTATIPPAERAVIAVPISIAMSRLLAQTDSIFPASDSLDRSKCSSMGGFV
jgi:hypothetical protein